MTTSPGSAAPTRPAPAGLALLHAVLVVRFVADLLGAHQWWQVGGLLGVLALLSFLLTAVVLVVRR